MQLHVNTQSGRIGLSINHPGIQIQSTNPQIELSITRPTLSIEQGAGELEIDTSPSRASIGLNRTSESIRKYADLGKQRVLEGMARISSEGDRLRSIETPAPAIPELAAAKLEDKPVEVGYTAIDPPQISFKPRQPEFHSSPGEINFQLNRGQIQVQPISGTVQAYMIQKPEIQFSVQNSNVDRYL